jgi:hypothetical protein
MNMEDVWTCSRYGFATLVQNVSMLRQVKVNKPYVSFWAIYVLSLLRVENIQSFLALICC